MQRLATAFIFVLLSLSAQGNPVLSKGAGVPLDPIEAGGPTTFCDGGGVVLSIKNQPEDATYQWLKDGQEISNADKSTYKAVSSGDYSARVIVNEETFMYTAIKVTVHPKPVAHFSFTPDKSCSNVPVYFTNSSSGTGLTFTWDFGDPASGTANKSTEINPRHTFIGVTGNGTQTFTVKLTTVSAAGCTNTYSATVSTNRIPGTELGGTGLTTYEGSPYFTQCNSVASSFTFTNISTTEGTNASYRLIWGDGGEPDFIDDNFISTTHTYSVGTHKLQFIVTGINGCKDTGTYNVFVGSNPAVGLGTPGNTSICSGSSITFPISGTESNPPGTVYTVTFNDGSPAVVFNHPAPPSVTHVFNNGSCGTTSQGYSNSFSASIEASNPCNKSSASVVPIYVSEKPVASFSVSPKDIVCINTLITLTDISPAANSIANNGSCAEGKRVWKITPATGWTIQSGNLGKFYDLTDPSLWMEGDLSAVISFQVPGTYKINLKKAGSALCGSDEAGKEICVNPLPVAAFEVDTDNGCGPLTVQTTNKSTLPNCGENIYSWTVTYAANGECLPNAADFSFLGGSNAHSSDPRFLFKNPGIYTLSLTATTPGPGCTSPAFSKTITVKAKPLASLVAPAEICQNVSLHLLATVNDCYAGSGATTYEWSFAGSSSTGAALLDPGPVTFNTAGTHAIIFTATNACGPSVLTRNIKVKPAPTVSLPSDQVLCGNAPVNSVLFTGSLPGTNFSWTNNNVSIGLKAGGSGNMPAFNAINNTGTPVSALIKVTPSKDGCTGEPGSFKITVNPQPPAPLAPSALTYCQQEPALPLSATALPGNELLWFDSPDPGNGSGTPPVPSTSTPGSAVYYVRQTNNYKCAGPVSVIAVSVTPVLLNNKISADQELCAGTAAAQLVPVATISGGSGVYGFKWQSSTDGESWMDINGADKAAFSPGSISVTTHYRRMVTSGACQVLSNTVTVTVLGVLDHYGISKAQTICQGSAAETLIGELPSGGSGQFVYQWQYSGNGSNWLDITGENSKDYQPGALTTSTYYRRKVNSGLCTAFSPSVLITVNPTPMATITPRDASICMGSQGAVMLNASAGVFPLEIELKLTRPDGSIKQIYQVINSNGTAVNVVGINDVVGVYTISLLMLKDNKGCVRTGEWSGTSIAIKPVPILNITPDTEICGGSSVVLTAGGATDYSWSPATGLSSVSGSTVTASPLVSTIYSVTGSTDGCSVATTVNVTVNPKPARPFTTGVTYCLNETASGLSAIPSIGHTLTWYDNPALSDGRSTAPVPPTDVAGTFVYYVTQAGSPGCASDPAVIQVIVREPIANNLVGDDQTLCFGSLSQTLYSKSNLTGGTGEYNFRWQLSESEASGWMDVLDSKTETFNYGHVITAVSFRRIVSSGNCASDTSNIVRFTVNSALKNFEISGEQAICAGTTPSLLIGNTPEGGDGSFLFSWEQSDNNNNWTTVDAATAENYQPPVLNSTTFYRRKVTSGSCIVYASPIKITVNPAPVISPIASATYCNETIVDGLHFTGIPADGISFRWTNDDTRIGLPEAGTGAIPAFTASNMSGLPVTANLVVFPLYTGGGISCDGVEARFSITVLPPIINDIETGTKTICSGQSVDVSGFPPAGGDGNYSYQWQSETVDGGWKDLMGEVNADLHFTPSQTVKVKRVVRSFACFKESLPLLITVQAPLQNNIIGAAQRICINTTASIITGSVPTGGDGSLLYEWDKSIDGGNTWTLIPDAVAGELDPGILSQTTFFRRRVATTLCSGPQSNISNSIAITVLPDAKAEFNPAVTIGCAPFSITPDIINIQNHADKNSDFLWYADDVLIGQGPGFPDYVLSDINESVSVKLKVLSIYGCRPDSTSHLFSTYKEAAPAFNVSTDEGCGPVIADFINTTPEAALYTYHWDFGNGQTTTNEQPETITFQPNPAYGDTIYTVRLSVISVCNTLSVAKEIRVKSSPKAIFAPDKTTGCSPMEVSFNNTSLGKNNTYTWEMGDGEVLSTTDRSPVSHTFHTSVKETFYVKLKAVNECGTDELQYALVVTPNTIKLDFAVNGDEQNGCAAHTVHFINNTKGATGFNWVFGDGNKLSTTKNIDTIKHVFLQAGTYSVQLQAFNSCSDTSTTETIEVFALPQPAFHADAYSACLGNQVRFTNQSTEATHYLWEFGDGTQSNLTNPAHRFNTNGSHQVILRTYRLNITGVVCEDSIKQVINIVSPDGTLTYKSGMVCNDNAVRFEVKAINTDSIRWDFGDGVTFSSDERIVYHTYDAAGKYFPSVSLENSAVGCVLPVTGLEEIQADRIKGGFFTAQEQLCGQTNILFTDTSHAFYGNAPSKWKFGDGTTDMGDILPRTYTSSGDYVIQQIAVGASGCTDTIVKTVYVGVHNIPKTNILAPESGCTQNEIKFTGDVQSIDVVNHLQWTFSDDRVMTNNPLITTFSQRGSYRIQLITGTVNGCFDTAVHNIKIDPGAVVEASNNYNLCIGSSIRLGASGANTYRWMPFEGLSCTDCPDPVATPVHTTPYIVEGMNEFGCKGYDTVVVSVIPRFKVTVSPDDSICIGNTTRLIAEGATSYQWFPATGLSSPTSPYPKASPSETIRYRLVGYDGYNCFTDTAYVLVAVGEPSSIDLGPDRSLSTGTLYPFNPVVKNSPVKQWSWTPATELNCHTCPDPIATIKKEITYIAQATNNYNCVTYDTINIKVFCENAQVFIPNAFTPDNDGLNDILMVRATGIVLVKSIRIFNRWGEMVFERSNFSPNDPRNGWDGKIRGMPAPPAVYVYTAEVLCENGASHVYKGNISIIK